MGDPFRFMTGMGFVVHAFCASTLEKPARNSPEKKPVNGNLAICATDSCATPAKLEHTP